MPNSNNPMRNRRITMATLTLAAGVAGALVAAPPANAANTNWTGGGDGTTFGQAANWSNGAPAAANASVISTDGAVVVMGSGNYGTHGLLVGDIGSAGSTLDITSGSLTSPYEDVYVGDLNNYGVTTLAGAKGTINQTGGTFTIGGQYPRYLLVAAAASSNLSSAAYGVYNFGGTSASSAPTLNATGISIGQRGNEVGVFSASGYGTLSTSNITLSQYGGSGTFSVSGSHESISVGSVSLSQYGTPVIDYTLGAGGASTLNVNGNVTFSNSSLSANNTLFNLALAPDFTANVGDTYTIINATGAFTGFGQFGNLANGQTLAVGNYIFQADYTSLSGGNQLSLQVTSAPAVPEPDLLGLVVGASAVGLLLLKKRRNVSDSGI